MIVLRRLREDAPRPRNLGRRMASDVRVSLRTRPRDWARGSVPPAGGRRLSWNRRPERGSPRVGGVGRRSPGHVVRNPEHLAAVDRHGRRSVHRSLRRRVLPPVAVLLAPVPMPLASWLGGRADAHSQATGRYNSRWNLPYPHHARIEDTTKKGRCDAAYGLGAEAKCTRIQSWIGSIASSSASVSRRRERPMSSWGRAGGLAGAEVSKPTLIL